MVVSLTIPSNKLEQFSMHRAFSHAHAAFYHQDFIASQSAISISHPSLQGTAPCSKVWVAASPPLGPRFADADPALAKRPGGTGVGPPPGLPGSAAARGREGSPALPSRCSSSPFPPAQSCAASMALAAGPSCTNESREGGGTGEPALHLATCHPRQAPFPPQEASSAARPPHERCTGSPSD